MKIQGFTLHGVIALTVLIAFLAWLVLPHIPDRRARTARLAMCTINLSKMHASAAAHFARHKEAVPTATGEEFWVTVIKKFPVVSDEEWAILTCPLNEDGLWGQSHYRGPRVPWSQLKADDPIAADKEGNHGEDESINVLFNDGRVMEAAPGDALWEKCRKLLSP